MTELQYSVNAQAQTPPAAIEAEEAVLGSILIDAETLKRIEFLEAADFYVQRNAWVYSAAQALRRAGQDVDYLTISQELERRGHLKEVGGPARLMTLINRTPTTMHAETYARTVKEKAGRRRLLEIARNLTLAAFDETKETSHAVSAGIDSLSRAVTSDKGARHWSFYLSQVYDEVSEAVANPREMLGMDTGFPDWNAISGGLNLGTVTRLIGDPGLGKSLLMMQLLVHAADPEHGGTPCALYELEMRGTQPTRRVVSWKTKIATTALRTGKINEAQVAAFIKALEDLEKLPVFMSDESHMTTAEIRADLTRLKEYHGVKVAAIDYEALIEGEGYNENDRRNKISDEIHAIAKDLDLAILSVGDMTKAGISGEVEGQGAAAGTAHEFHNADEMIHMKATKIPGVIGLKWVKLREPSGAGNYMELVKLPGFPAFGPVSKKSS